MEQIVEKCIDFPCLDFIVVFTFNKNNFHTDSLLLRFTDNDVDWLDSNNDKKELHDVVKIIDYYQYFATS